MAGAARVVRQEGVLSVAATRLAPHACPTASRGVTFDSVDDSVLWIDRFDEEIHVKSILIKAIAVLAVTGAPALALAQQDDRDVQRAAQAADREDRGEWGWLGLLGLAGLLGLKRRDRVDHMSTRERASPAR
jgi:hypothetical protein